MQPSNARASLNRSVENAFQAYGAWFRRHRVIGYLPSLGLYLLCLGIIWSMGGPYWVLVTVGGSLAFGMLFAVLVGVVIFTVVRLRRR